MTAEVVQLGDVRLLRQCVAKMDEMEQQMLVHKFTVDDALMRQTASARLVEMGVQYEALINHLRESWFEMTELALIVIGNDRDLVGAQAVILRDMRHATSLPELLAARRASMLTEHTRMKAAGMGALLEPPAAKEAPAVDSIALRLVPVEPTE